MDQQTLLQNNNLNTQGFTLIELLIAIAIVGILAGIALPYYKSYVQEGRNANAFTSMTVLASRLESNFLDNRHYGLAGDRDGATCSASAVSIDNYSITCATTPNSVGYDLTATSTDNNYIYHFKHDGTKKTTQFAGESAMNDCWLKTAVVCY